MATASDQIRNAILGHYPLIYLLTWEESRVIQLLEAFSTKLFGPGVSFQVWSCVRGFSQGGSTEPITNPLNALKTILASEEKGFVVLKDFSSFMTDPSVTRALRDAYYALQGKEKYIFIISPELFLPENLKKEILLIDVGLPDEGEMLKLVKRMEPLYPQAVLPDDLVGKISFALKGMTLNEATHILHRILRSKKIDADEVMQQIFSEKEMIVKKSGCLEFVAPSSDIADIGGLDTLKEWLVKEKNCLVDKRYKTVCPCPGEC